MQRFSSRLLIALLAAPLALVSSTAFAGSAADCGNLELLATGTCDFEVTGGCSALCEPPNLVAACDGKCSASADISCSGGCSASCEAECDVNPGSFDCEADCSATCKSGCSSSCSAATNACQTQCEASCDNRCSIKCQATPPSATCKAKCQASCDASCTVQANVDCSIDCTVELQGGCKVDCESPQGALFCDGQYVHAGNVEGCLDYLGNAGFNVQASASCDAGGCEASVGCAAAPYVGAPGDRLAVGSIAGLMVGLGLVASRRRRRS